MTYPYMSVVVPSFNGAKIIGRTIEALQRQEYPRDRFEIIVIDDCSRDNTADIARSYGVRVISLPVNGGLSSARNAGLEAARGDIYVAMDDDCIAKPALLKVLAKGYASGNPAGVGSYLEPLEHGKTLIEQYMNATATGAGIVSQSAGKSVFSRFWKYLASKVSDRQIEVPERMSVHELFGANGTYPVDVLRAVGGWDKTMSGIEDRDLCSRITKAFPGRPFYAMRDAKILHQPNMTLAQYLMRPYKRGIYNYKFHKINNITPSVFPFPLATLAAVAAVGAWGLGSAFAAALLVPQLLYFWWPYRAARSHKLDYLVFAYIQLAEESMVIAGLVRGLLSDLKDRSRRGEKRRAT